MEERDKAGERGWGRREWGKGVGVVELGENGARECVRRGKKV